MSDAEIIGDVLRRTVSDRTSAEIFVDVFTYLAAQPKTPERDAFARKAWEWTGKYDFSPYQLDADDALIALGLAVRVPDQDDPDGSLMVFFDGDEGFEDALAAGAPSEGA